MILSVVTYNDGDNRTTKADEVSKILSDVSPDIFGLQEVQEIHVPVYLEKTGDYACVYFDNDGTTYNSQPIFYKRSRFELVDSGIKWLSDTPDVKFSKYPESAYIRSCTYALLKEKESGEMILAVNTHIDYTAKGNAMQVARIIETVKALGLSAPTFVMGDWNMRRTSAGYGILEGAGYIAAEELVENAVKAGTCVDEDKTIDFIFVDSQSIGCDEYKVVNDHEYSKTASDHFPVYAKINTKK